MINVNDATKSAYSGDSINKTLTITVPNRNITFTNSDLVSQSMELTESIESERSLSFKGCIASQFKFSVANIVTDLRGEYIEAKIQAGNTQEIPLFKGYIDEQNNQTHEDIVTEFTCYDELYKKGDIECGEWYDSLGLPMSVKEFRNRFFAQIGITQESVDLVNDGLIMQRTVSANTSMKARYIMECICQANARYGIIGRDGKFHYIKLEGAQSSIGTYPGTETFPSAETYPAKPINTQVVTNSMYKDVDYNPFPTEKVTKVVVWDEAEIVKGEAGTGTNIFKITGNMVAYSVDLNTCARNIFNEIRDVACVSTRISLVGLPFVECGDLYKYNTRINMINDYVLSRTLKGIQALQDDFTSDLDQYQSDDDSLSNQIIKLNGKTNILTRTVDETKSELSEKVDNETFTSTISATAREIRSEVVSSSQVWDTGNKEIYAVFYSDDANYRPDNMVNNRYYLNQTKGILWRRDGNNYYSDQCPFVGSSASSVITQQSNKIESKVSVGDVSSTITQESGKISIKSNRISIDSTNFTLNEDGTIKAINGEFSGKIIASSGQIGGFTIGSQNIRNGTGSTFSNFTNGVYLGTDGIKVIGSYGGFSVNSAGHVKVGTGSGGYFQVGDGIKVYSESISVGNAITISDYSNLGAFVKIGTITISSTDAGEPYIGNYLSDGNANWRIDKNKIRVTGTDWQLIHFLTPSSTQNQVLLSKSGVSDTAYRLFDSGSRVGVAINSNNNAVILGYGLIHVNVGGSYLHFFSTRNSTSTTDGASQQTVNKLSSSANLSTVITKINDLLTALAKYNLIVSR